MIAFFKKLIAKIKALFGKKTAESESKPTADVVSTIADYNAQAHHIEDEEVPTTSIPTHPNTSIQAHKAPPVQQKVLTQMSEVVEHQVDQTAPQTHLSLLIDALGLEADKIVNNNNVVTIPFDASGCDFDTKRQLALALSTEYQLQVLMRPTSIVCTEAAKRAFGCLKYGREECFLLGCIFFSVTQDIDADGFIVAEVTNIDTGRSVLFDIPATIDINGSVDVDFDVILKGLKTARNTVAPKE